MTLGLRASFVVVASIGIASTLCVDGNPRGPAAIAAQLARRGAESEARIWMRRATPSLARFHTTIVDGRLVADDGALRALKFAVRDDAARAWWLERRAIDSVKSNGASSR
ncbi:MAG: hypothetical protein IPH13_14910 [Planctomycetes bacterium]|nr:hypothetical protein [Planctomycetota bacterium]MCC7170981.1 hypothetical protein [Planctomycetota bacterium]